MKKILFIAAIFMVVALSSCSNYFYNKANKEFDYKKYNSAIEHYNKVSSKNKHYYKAIEKLAHSYRFINDMQNAEKYYRIIVNNINAEPINMFYYSKVLVSMGNCVEAKKWMQKYLISAPNDIVANMLLASCNSVTTFMSDTSLYTLSSIDFPEFESLYGAVNYKDGVVFTADKSVNLNSKKEPWTGKSYYDLYFAEKDSQGRWLSPTLLKGDINGKYHEGPATFNKEGDVVYFTRSNYFKHTLKTSSKNESNLKIFRAELVDDKWENITELPFNSDEYSIGHPALASDGKTLYFISDMPGGYGGTDIYSVIFDGEGWSTPQNLGSVINTPGNEMFPFMSNDHSFYFSSDAHNNMGGLDVFVSSYDERNKKWLQVENLNYPLNSTKDDFAIVFNDDNKTGYVSSNRVKADNLYTFQKHDPTFGLKGKVTDKVSKKPLVKAGIALVSRGEVVNDTIYSFTDMEGNYKIKLMPNTTYTVLCSMENYFSESYLISTVGKKLSEDFEKNFEMTEMVIEKPIVLENIYYDLDKWEIRPDAALELDKLVKILNDNPNIHIEMGAHTDSRAGDMYNLVLSNNRAKAAVEYLISKGINQERLNYKGYGETMLVNRCKNNVECSEEEHQQNRRTEFKVIKINKEKMSQ